jgi:hypothetical protein
MMMGEPLRISVRVSLRATDEGGRRHGVQDGYRAVPHVKRDNGELLSRARAAAVIFTITPTPSTGQCYSPGAHAVALAGNHYGAAE